MNDLTIETPAPDSPETVPDETTPVLIVGGGYAGLAAALFLGHQGVRSVLVDRHPGVSVQGRARGINQRTMELYRALGLETLIEQAGQPFDSEVGVVRCESLAGEWNWLLADESRQSLPDLTACRFGMADQRSVEPILIDAARHRGADIRFGTRCVALGQDAGAVTAVLEESTGGPRRTIRAQYAIAADGFRGGLRERAGIGRSGPGVTQNWVTFLIEADLSRIVHKRAMFWIVVNDEIGLGSFLTTSVPDQWAVSIGYDPERSSAEDFTPARGRQIARSVIGADVPVSVLDVAVWEEAVAVADQYRSRRIFLAGDAAHVWPPAGAMGANAAVQDAHNLAWKLAAVLGGRAGDRLLDSYQDERRPVAQALAAITVRRQEARFGGRPNHDDVDDTLCALGQRYRSSAVIGAEHEGVYGTELPASAAPGTRAPHLWLTARGRRISAQDLFHDAFVLLTGPDGIGWTQAVAGLDAGVAPVRGYRVGTDLDDVDLVDVDGVWAARYDLGPAGAVLVRPDGYVARRWPGAVLDPAGELTAALRAILSSAAGPSADR